MLLHIPHWLDLSLAVIATGFAAIEVWRLQRGAGGRWWLIAYVGFAVAFATFAVRKS